MHIKWEKELGSDMPCHDGIAWTNKENSGMEWDEISNSWK